MKEGPKKIKMKNKLASQTMKRPQISIIPHKTAWGSGRNLRSSTLSPFQYIKFGGVRKRIDAPHFKRELNQIYPFIDKTITVSFIEEKTTIEKLKDKFQKEIYGKKCKWKSWIMHLQHEELDSQGRDHCKAETKSEVNSKKRDTKGQNKIQIGGIHKDII